MHVRWKDRGSLESIAKMKLGKLLKLHLRFKTANSKASQIQGRCFNQDSFRKVFEPDEEPRVESGMLSKLQSREHILLIADARLDT